MKTRDEHEHWMQQCIELGKRALQSNNPPVGSILVGAGKIVSLAAEEARSSGDVTDHAEMIALRKAMAVLHNGSRPELTIYSTHEPCVLCAYAIRHYRIETVVFGSRVPYVGGYSSKYALLRDSGHPAWSEPPVIIEGVLVSECDELTRNYTILKSKRSDRAY